jgi:Uma2 family endonuclease
MTFAEFERLPDPHVGRYELRHGELVTVAPPNTDHFIVQQALRDLLDQAAAGAGRAYTEAGFRPRPEFEYRIADVAYASKEYWIRPKGQPYYIGAPALVIEVLSPSNTVAEMVDKRKLCLENGSQEFWVVDVEQRQVEVSTPDGHTVAYQSGGEIPLFFASGRLAVDAIFK